MEEIKAMQNGAAASRACGNCGCTCWSNSQDGNYNNAANSNREHSHDPIPPKCTCTCDPVGQANSAHSDNHG